MESRKVFLFVGFLLFASMAFVLSPTSVMAQVAEDCDDGIDNDGDKLVDCKDPNCSKSVKCEVTADCSPGFYKNHLLNADPRKRLCPIECPAVDITIGVEECAGLVLDLSAELGSDAATRAAAKAILDACYGTAEASPCEDDD